MDRAAETPALTVRPLRVTGRWTSSGHARIGQPALGSARPTPGGQPAGRRGWRRRRHGDVLIEYYSLDRELIAFARRGTSIELREVCSLDEVESLVDKLSFQIGKCSLGSEYVMENLRRGVDRCLQQLYKKVIVPIDDLLQEGDRLVVVPHPALHGLPFHAFHDGERYLVERHVIAIAPSAAVMHACRQAARPIGERALVVGIDHPYFLAPFLVTGHGLTSGREDRAESVYEPALPSRL